MNDSPNRERDRLLAETLQDDWSQGPLAAAALRAAGTVRRRRVLRHAALTVGAAAALTLGGLWVSMNHHPHDTAQASPLPSRREEQPVVTPSRPAYEILSDAELLEAVRDQSVILIADSRGFTRAILPERAANPRQP